MDLKRDLMTETVAEAGIREPLCVEEGTSIRDVLLLLKEKGGGHLLVCRDGVLRGIFTERDALRLLAAGADLEAAIETAMVKNVVTVQPTDTLATAIGHMSKGGYRRLPIVDEQGRPVGVTKVTHIVHWLVEHFPETIYNLPPDPNKVMPEREGA